jgi:hypothetical protein
MMCHLFLVPPQIIKNYFRAQYSLLSIHKFQILYKSFSSRLIHKYSYYAVALMAIVVSRKSGSSGSSPPSGMNSS